MGLWQAGFEVVDDDNQAGCHVIRLPLLRQTPWTFPLEGYDFIWA